jgi:hypothetical protein
MGLYKHIKNTNKPVIRQILDLVPPWLFKVAPMPTKQTKALVNTILMTNLYL